MTTIKRITVFYIIIVAISCSGKNHIESTYSLFLRKYGNSNFYSLNTRLNLDFNSIELPLIDTAFLKPLNLIDTTRKDEKDAQMKKLSDYNCRLISVLRFDKFDCVLTDSYTISADSGYPVLIISIFNKSGKFVSRIIYNHRWQNDYTPVPKQYLTINDRKEITLELIEKNYEIVDSLGIEILRYVNTTLTNKHYLIEDNGQITLANSH